MQVIGQPARDLARHFVQRYVLLVDNLPTLSYVVLPSKMELFTKDKGTNLASS
jgi:phosphatidylserine/phosphatidylglycerophosphate/cardiolipin synthase-like enzyme